MLQRLGLLLVLAGLVTVLGTVFAMLSHVSGTAAPALAAFAAAAGGALLVAGMLVLERTNTASRAATEAAELRPLA
jgi:hypothetical protein